ESRDSDVLEVSRHAPREVVVVRVEFVALTFVRERQGDRRLAVGISADLNLRGGIRVLEVLIERLGRPAQPTRPRGEQPEGRPDLVTVGIAGVALLRDPHVRDLLRRLRVAREVELSLSVVPLLLGHSDVAVGFERSVHHGAAVAPAEGNLDDRTAAPLYGA